MARPHVRPMTAADLDPIAAAILADDWGDRRAWFTYALSEPQCRTFVAETDDGDRVGSGVATINGSVGWIGTIWVAPAWRGQGLGHALTMAPIEAAEAAGCRTLVLVATDAGRPLYERLGFKVQTWYRTMEHTGLPAAPAEMAQGDADRRVRPWRPDDLEPMVDLDHRATGEDRRHLLAAFATPDGTRIVAGGDDRPRGFLLRPTWGGGATIAPDPADAFALLDARRRASGPDHRIRAGVLEANPDGIARLEAAGWHEAWRAPRLIRGEPLDWRPDWIWGQFNHAVG